MKNFNAIEQLSSYLDGQLNPADSARLESRISADPGLASALTDLRAARGLLRKMPSRKAPRNFTLTRKMVGFKPPLPQSYSFFRFSSAIAAVLLLFTFAANSLTGTSFGAAAPLAQDAYGFGGGGGGSDATEAPAAAEAPALASSMELAVIPTATQPDISADSTRIEEVPTIEAPLPKEPAAESEAQNQLSLRREAVVPITWQVILLIIGLTSAGLAFVIHQNARKKWS